METVEELVQKLQSFCDPGFKGRLAARGMARGMIWDEGTLPKGSPDFSPELSEDLLNHGYQILGCCIRLRHLSPNEEILDIGFRTAAESIESAVRRGTIDTDRGFHLTIAAAAFHLGHYAARSFSLVAENSRVSNLASVEKLLIALMQRRLDDLEQLCLDWLTNEANADDGIAQRLEEDGFGADEAAYLSLIHI